MSAGSAETETAPGAYFALCALLLAYILSFIDRNVMAVLIGPIRAEFSISDFQYSLLHGFAFSMFYIVLGLPIARLADKGSRKWVITAGVFVWSLMTCLCGLTRSFSGLFFARIGVGVGEAALSPPAYSILSDYFSERALPRALAVYTLGITIGGGLAYIVGGAVYEYFTAYGPLSLPLVGELRPWQTTFIIVGVPGFLLVALLCLMTEPARRGAMPAGVDGYAVTEVRDHLVQHWQAYGSLIMGVSLLAVLGYGTQCLLMVPLLWQPTAQWQRQPANRSVL